MTQSGKTGLIAYSTIFDSFKTVVDCIRRAPKEEGGGGPEGGQEVVKKNLKRKM